MPTGQCEQELARAPALAQVPEPEPVPELGLALVQGLGLRAYALRTKD